MSAEHKENAYNSPETSKEKPEVSKPPPSSTPAPSNKGSQRFIKGGVPSGAKPLP